MPKGIIARVKWTSIIQISLPLRFCFDSEPLHRKANSPIPRNLDQVTANYQVSETESRTLVDYIALIKPGGSLIIVGALLVVMLLILATEGNEAANWRLEA